MSVRNITEVLSLAVKHQKSPALYIITSLMPTVVVVPTVCLVFVISFCFLSLFDFSDYILQIDVGVRAVYVHR